MTLYHVPSSELVVFLGTGREFWSKAWEGIAYFGGAEGESIVFGIELWFWIFVIISVWWGFLGMNMQID